MINFLIGAYVMGVIIALFLWSFLNRLGGKSKTLGAFIVSTILLAIFWPFTIWFVKKI